MHDSCQIELFGISLSMIPTKISWPVVIPPIQFAILPLQGSAGLPSAAGEEPPWPALLSPPGGGEEGVGVGVEGHVRAVLAIAQVPTNFLLLYNPPA